MKTTRALLLAATWTAALAALPAAKAIAQSADTGTTATAAWQYSLGFGVMNAPLYAGADKTRFRALPLISASNNRYFAGMGGNGVPPGVGIYLYRDQQWQAGAALGYDIYSPRRERDDESRLHGLGDIQRTLHSTLFARYKEDSLSVFGALIGSADHQGFQFKLGSELSFKLSPQLQLSTGPSLTWSSSRSNQTFFGISESQSAASGLSQYSPTAGISDVSYSISLTYLLSPKWSIGSRLSTSYLPNNVNQSPVVERPATASYSIFTGYRF